MYQPYDIKTPAAVPIACEVAKLAQPEGPPTRATTGSKMRGDRADNSGRVKKPMNLSLEDTLHILIAGSNLSFRYVWFAFAWSQG